MNEITPQPILQLATGYMAAKHLFVANEVGLFRALASGPRSLDELAAQAGIPRRTMRILADAQVALGLLEREDARYCNGPVAAAFLSGTGSADLGPLLRFWDHLSYPAWQGLEQAVRSDQTQTHHGGFTEEEQRIFSAGVEALTAGPAAALASCYDWSRHRRVLDLGGGTGSFLLAVRKHYPELAGTLFELPTVAPVARQRLSAEPSGTTIEVAAGDFFSEPLPRGHDAVIVANVAHLFSPEQNLELLRRIRESVPSGARLLLVDFWTDPGHTEPRLAALLAAEFLIVAGNGDVYSEAEVRGWLREADWRFVERVALGGPASLIVAETSA
jgi:SAM-dependent methyltransferase